MTSGTERRNGRETIGAEVRQALREFIARRVGDRHVAEDLTQDVLLKAYRSGTDVEGLDDLAAWLYRIARNTVIDYFRARDRRPDPAAIPDGDYYTEDPIGDDRAVAELAQCLRPLVEHLEPIYREALTLTALDGLTQTEAARRTGISISGMKSRVQRARAQLRAALVDCCAVWTDAGGRVSGYTSSTGCRCAGQKAM